LLVEEAIEALVGGFVREECVFRPIVITRIGVS
jgi:hypothetical protein